MTVITYLRFSGQLWFQNFCPLVHLRTLVFFTLKVPKCGSEIMVTVPAIPGWQLGGLGRVWQVAGGESQ